MPKYHSFAARLQLAVRILFSLHLIIICGLAGISEAKNPDSGQGSLLIIEPDGKPGTSCPLEHTAVSAELSGFSAGVTVTQIFSNPASSPIEAVYTFPLSSEGAVDYMTITVGDRVIKGKIKRREEARQIYEAAKRQGKTAGLLDQERPNIFTQSLANIMPGEKVKVTIHYNELLPYEEGQFKFVFPMVVGPRFIPGAPKDENSRRSAASAQVPDASSITPPVAREGTRAGHDLSLQLKINAGVPIRNLTSQLHEIKVSARDEQTATIELVNKEEIPNRDFVLHYEVAADKITSGVLAHKSGKEGFATIVLLPPKSPLPSEIAPRELIFVIDCSGSQFGLPLEKAKETMRYVIGKMASKDTFNIVDFNQGSRMLFSEPKPNTEEYREKALQYLAKLEARGGTWMGPAIEKICNAPAPENRLRIVTFMTDGYVGNDFEIINMVQKLRGKSRWFLFGTGNSVNRFLLDKMAQVGGGESEVILLNAPGEQVAEKFYRRIAAPVLTDIQLETSGLELLDIYPKAVSDLWANKPLVFKARYAKAGSGKILLKGKVAGKEYQQSLDVNLPALESANPSLATMWAKAQIDDLMNREWLNIQKRAPSPELREEIIRTALTHGIMSQYTSFVAVEEKIVNESGSVRTIDVPVELPHGVSEERISEPEQGYPAAVGNRSPASSRHYFTGSAAPPQYALKEYASRTKDEKELPKADTRSSRVQTENQVPEISEPLKQLIQMLKVGQDPSSGPVKIWDGKIRIKITISRDYETMASILKAHGFVIEKREDAGSVLIGTLPVEKLVLLAQLGGIVEMKTAE